MSDDNNLKNDPTGRAVALFDDHQHAESAKADLIAMGVEAEDVRLLHGHEDARQVDDSPKWFADTDDVIAIYKRRLEAGASVVSVPVADEPGLKKLQAVFVDHGARMMTHFGRWLTQTRELDG